METTEATVTCATNAPKRQNLPFNGLQTLLLTLLILISIGVVPALALDYPHTSTQGVTCFNCHAPPSNLTDALCLRCHNGSVATVAVSHSSANTSTTYGNWTMNCTTCHQPHVQDQYWTYGNESLVVTGFSDAGGITANSLTMSGAGWEVSSLAGMVLIPDLNNDTFSYKIIGNTADTITVNGSIDLAQIGNGNTNFGVIYGNLIRGEIREWGGVRSCYDTIWHGKT